MLITKYPPLWWQGTCQRCTTEFKVTDLEFGYDRKAGGREVCTCPTCGFAVYVSKLTVPIIPPIVGL